jgi:predicted transcriptional regulator
MSTVKTAISINEALFQRAEQLAQELQVSRSRLFAQAMEEFLSRRENKALLAAINEAHENGLDEEEQAWLAAVRRNQRRLSDGEG